MDKYSWKLLISIISVTFLVLGLLVGMIAYWGGFGDNELAKISIITIIFGGIFFIISVFFPIEGYHYTRIRPLMNTISSPDFRWSVNIILLTLIWVGVAPAFYRMITKSAIVIWLERFYNLFNHNVLLNIPFCFCVILFFYYRSKRIVEKSRTQHSTQYYCLFLIVFAYFLLYWESPFKYASIVWFMDYRVFLSVLLLFPAVSCIWSQLYYGFERKISRSNRIEEFRRFPDSFSTEGVSYSEISDDLKEYARSIVRKLLRTDLNAESFAMGITSEWGAGKTTFLNILINELQSNNEYPPVDVDIVEFNPWMCSTPEQVTSDFFSSLRHQLSDKHRELSNPIKQYARYLRSASLRFHGLTIKFSGLFSEKSLFERKKDLSEKFSMLGHKIIVFIDDVDRLESSEVLEVLRLIRNTADLSNMIYIVAFDKDYVTSVLEQKKIDDPTAYLEKIFQVEIQLPLVPKEKIMSTLINEIAYYSYNIVIVQEVDFHEYNKDLILKVITTYRKAKRFARLFSLNYSHLKQNSFDQLVWQDVFWLDLLQMSDKNTYDYILCNNPTSILKEKDSCWVYYDTLENQEIFKDKPITHSILLKLFGDFGAETPPEYSIRHTKYYDKYFTMQVQFSKTDLETLFDTDNVDKLVKEWSEKQKPIDNISRIVRNYGNDQLDEIKKRKLINGVFAIMYYYRHDYGMKNIFNSINNVSVFEELRTWFYHKLEEDYELPRIIRVLSIFLWEYEDAKTVIIPLLEKMLDVFFQKHTRSTVMDLIGGNEDFYEIAEEILWMNRGLRGLIIEGMIERYSQKKIKPMNKEFDTAKIDNKSILGQVHDDKEKDNYLQMIKETCCSDKPIKPAKKKRGVFTRKNS